MKKLVARCFAATTMGLVGQAASAQEINSTYADVTGSLGYSTQPFFQSNKGGSPFASLSATLMHRRFSERTSTELSGYLEGSEYFHYGLKGLASVRGRTTHAVNERLSVLASGALTADYNGQLANRFLNVTQPGETDTGPVTSGIAPDSYMYAGRQYRADGEVGLTWHTSERSQFSLSTGASREILSQNGLRDHTSENVSLGYLRSISERTNVGAHLDITGTQYDGSDDAAIIINPAATIKSHLSPEWTVTGSAGASFSRVRHLGRTAQSTEPSFRGSLCHESMRENLCLLAAHFTHGSAVAELITESTVGIDWIRKLDAIQTLQLSAEYLRFSNARATTGPITDTQYRVAAIYSRLINERASFGVEASAHGYAAGSPGRRSDVSASVFLRYRWGSLR